MFSTICNEIKNKIFLSNQKQIQPLSEKLIETIQEQVFVQEKVFVQEPAQIKSEQIKPEQKNNKLISCYEEDYTRNSAEIMKYWQRN